ncbi:MAG: glutathione S-transferase family protein [Candidatus Binatia bacterium]
MITVYGANVSPFVRKVRVFLAEKNIAYKLEPINPFTAGPEYRKISPLGRIPAFQDENVTLADSSVICAYVEKIHPQPALYPSTPADYAQALWFEEYGDGGLAPIFGAEIFRQRVVMPLFFKQQGDEAMAQKAIAEKLPGFFDYLEGQVRDGAMLVGNQLSIGDIGVATQFVNLRHAGVTVDAQRWPKLARYIATVHGRPSFRALIEEEEAALKKARG